MFCEALIAVVLFSGFVLSAGQNCATLLPLDKHEIDLDACRPAPVGPEEKNKILQSLPTEGELTQLSEDERRKLQDLMVVLRLHRREKVYEVKVISVPQAWTGLYERAVLLISHPALQLLSSKEIQALTAHEIGHEYLWQEYKAAEQGKKAARLRELELACDAIAVLTLERLGIQPDHLIAALEKVSRFNRERFGLATNTGNYPSIKARRKLVRDFQLFRRLDFAPRTYLMRHPA